FIGGTGGAQALGTTDVVTFSATPLTGSGTGIIKGAIVTDTAAGTVNLATSTGSAPFSVSALTTYPAFVAGGNAAGDNVLISANATLTAANAANSYLIRGDNIQISASAGGPLTLTPASGMFVIVDATTSTGNSFTAGTAATTAVPNFGANEGIIITA